MLKYKINKNNIYERYRQLPVSLIGYNSLKGDKIKINFSENHSLKDGDIILFTRTNSKGDISYFDDERIVTVVDNDSVLIDWDNEYYIYPTSYDIIENYPILSGEGIEKATESQCNLMVFHFDYSSHDIIFGYDDFVIKGEITIDEEGNVIRNDKVCDNSEIYSYKGVFLYDLSQSGVSNIINYQQNVEVLYNGLSYPLENCFVSYTYDSYGNVIDDKRTLYWIYDENSAFIKEIITNNFESLSFITENLRFFNVNDRFTPLKRNSKLFKVDNSIHIPLMFNEQFEGNMNQHEFLMEKLVQDKIDEKMPKSVDMEKQVFEPIFSCSGVTKNPLSINFGLNFKERILENVDIVGGWSENNVNDKWRFGNEITGDKKPSADNLGFLGFTDDDVYYRKNSLRKSFLRLSFYDTQSRANQSLLYYSTIFFDENKMYANYISDLYNPSFKDSNGIICNSGTTVTASLSTYNKYNFSSCSEGFYLHLYPNLCKYRGGEDMKIYMKAEFNHAKFGYTIPLMLWNGSKTCKYLPKNGSNNETETYEKVLKDLYSEITIKYDSANNRFTWSVPYTNCDENNNLFLTLVEPMIGYEKNNT